MQFSKDWYSPDIEVIIRDSHEDSGLCGQIGVVRGVTPGKLRIQIRGKYITLYFRRFTYI